MLRASISAAIQSLDGQTVNPILPGRETRAVFFKGEKVASLWKTSISKEPAMADHDHTHEHNTGDLHRELHAHLPSEPALRVKAMESLLVEKGLLDPDTVDAWVEVYSEKIGPKCGARIVARAWTDTEFKARLLEDGTEAVKDIDGVGWAVAHLRVIENTHDVHNLVVCTLCSCYPHAILGPPPNWYKMAAYRSRAVRDPRGVLEEFGVTLPEGAELKVWDSTSELRYLVLPQRPAETEDWDEEKLASIVTRNSMIGTQRDLEITKAAD
jgi:nitrile hydratase